MEELTRALVDLVARFRATRDECPLFAAGADAAAAELWELVEQVDLGTASSTMAARVTRARAALGAFHHVRHGHAPTALRPTELAKAVLCLEPVADDALLVPPDLRPVVGRFTDPRAQAELGTALLAATPTDDGPALLDAAIALLESARHVVDAGGAAALGRAYRLRHERGHDPDDLDAAIITGESAVDAVGNGGPHAVRAWTELATSYWSGYLLYGDLEALHLAVQLFERALEHAPPDADSLLILSSAYRRHHDHTGDPRHLDRAVELGERALRDPDDTAAPTALAAALLRRHDRTGSDDDLRRATGLGERLIARSTPEHPDHGTHVACASAILLRRYARTGDVTHLHQAVELDERALRALPDEDRERREVTAALTEALHRRHSATGSESDLARAVTIAGWAVAATPEGHPDRGQRVMALAAALLTRYAFRGVVTDLTRAIALGTDVVADTDPCPAGWLSLLGHAHERHHLLTADPADLDRAVDLGERAVSATADDDVALAARWARLAAAHWARHRAHGDVADLDRAVDLLAAALARSPGEHPDVPLWQAESAVAHLDRYHLSGAAADVETAVDLGERALANSPADAPGRLRIVADLCAAHTERVLLGRGEVDVPRLVAEVVDAPGASPLDRVAAHHSAGVLARTTGHAHLAVELLDAAVALLSSVAPREAGWADQQHRIGTRGGLVGDAVAAHCAIDDPVGAFQAAELGRGVLLAGQASTRVDLTALREHAPHLADRFHWVCERLNTPGFPTDERKRWWAQYDALIGDIHEVPGLADFGVPIRPDDLRRVPAGGTAVLVNTSRHRCDAVLLRSDADPVVIALPDLRQEEAERRVAEMFAGVEDYEPDTDDVVRDILSWLWDSVVKPVVDALRASEPHRVWWLPTGVLGLLPLHAAGPADGEGALDLLVSSYTTSLRALRTPTGTVLAEQDRLVVSVPEKEDMPPLPAARREADSLKGRHLTGPTATAAEVLAALPHATSAHFACHAVVDLVTQADSGLVLHDRTLRLPEIGALRLHDAELAYLSACSTGNHGTRYADEVLHVGAAFQLAGFRHVIATLWPLNDSVGGLAARSFHRALATADDAATVLRDVALELRDTFPDNPTQWAPLIHSGP